MADDTGRAGGAKQPDVVGTAPLNKQMTDGVPIPLKGRAEPVGVSPDGRPAGTGVPVGGVVFRIDLSVHVGIVVRIDLPILVGIEEIQVRRQLIARTPAAGDPADHPRRVGKRCGVVRRSGGRRGAITVQVVPHGIELGQGRNFNQPVIVRVVDRLWGVVRQGVVGEGGRCVARRIPQRGSSGRGGVGQRHAVTVEDLGDQVQRHHRPGHLNGGDQYGRAPGRDREGVRPRYRGLVQRFVIRQRHGVGVDRRGGLQLRRDTVYGVAAVRRNGIMGECGVLGRSFLILDRPAVERQAVRDNAHPVGITFVGHHGVGACQHLTRSVLT